jgi:hypothetical protein
MSSDLQQSNKVSYNLNIFDVLFQERGLLEILTDLESAVFSMSRMLVPPRRFAASRALKRMTICVPPFKHIPIIKTCDILTYDLIELIEYSYHQDTYSFLKDYLQRTSRLSVFYLEQFRDG